MPCRVDICDRCREYNCICHTPEGKLEMARRDRAVKFDFEGALCDVLSLIEQRAPAILSLVDTKVLAAWRAHQRRERKKL